MKCLALLQVGHVRPADLPGVSEDAGLDGLVLTGFGGHHAPTCPPICRTLLPMAGRTSTKRASARLRSERLEARISSEEKALFQRAADLQGRTLTDFVIASAHESAVKTTAELEAVRLTAADSRAFAEALLHPREPSPELRTAAERYRKMVGGEEFVWC